MSDALAGHPLLRRWLAGELTGAELRAFASEHYHVICALERAARLAAEQADGLLAASLLRYADECRESVGPWCEFASATGWGSAWYFGEDPLPETVACTEAIVGEERSLAEHLVTIQALESGFAELAPGQHDALLDRYGFAEADARYFAVSVEQSARAAATAEAGLIGLGAGADTAHELFIQRSYLALLDAAEDSGLGGQPGFGRDRQADEAERQRQPI